MSNNVVIKGAVNCLIHVPDLVQYGSKPRREIQKDKTILEIVKRYLRTYEETVFYAPNQTFIGNLSPEKLWETVRPWYRNLISGQNIGKFGEIMNQGMFLKLLKLADVFNFFDTDKKIIREDNLPIYNNGDLVGYFNRDNRAQGVGDKNLDAYNLLENLCAKASGALAMKWLFQKTGLKPGEVDYILSCDEEALGDRYQRGGGGMAKAIGHMCGCLNASGFDPKNFCAAPTIAIVVAAQFVKAGTFKNIVVIGGGSLAKLGMKFESFVQEKMPILDDCLGAFACLVSKDDKVSPIIRTGPGAFGIHSIGAGATDSLVYENVITKPLKALGLKFSDLDKIAPELQNPEIMEFAGAGDVAQKNYRKIADEAVENGEINEDEMDDFAKKIGMPGFAPTQGHIPSAVPYLAHAIKNIKQRKMKRVMFVGKASLFLNRIYEGFDAVSFILEKNPKQK
ncbi:glycine reductase [Patescibacteria group bacterium]|nr:glycine reductase [Patescibacteria group bacterium]